MSCSFCPSQPVVKNISSKSLAHHCTLPSRETDTLQKQNSRPLHHHGVPFEHRIIQTTRMGERWSTSRPKRVKILAGAAIAAMFFSGSLHALPVSGHEAIHAPQDVKPKTALVPVPQRLSRSNNNADKDNVNPLRARWDIHSVASHTETIFVLENKSSSMVDLWWIDYCGREVYYASVSPGATHVQPSFTKHPWVVRDHVSYNPVLRLVATENPVHVVINHI